MTEKSHEYLWVLSVATEPRSKVKHSFGWDPVAQEFVVESGETQECLPVPVALAEAFLLKCFEKDFRERFLVDWSRAEQESFEVEDARLVVYRGKIRDSCTGRKPKLLLWVSHRGDSKNIALIHELRSALKDALKALSPEEIRAHLHPQAAAA